MPAGHIERYESVLAAACREAAEEIGVQVAETDLVPLTAMHRTHPDHAPIDERIDVFFECRRWTGEPRLSEPSNAAEVGWFGLDALPSPVVGHERFVLNQLRAGTLAAVTVFGFAAPDGRSSAGPGE